jgi:Meiotically up-regulated gene 113
VSGSGGQDRGGDSVSIVYTYFVHSPTLKAIKIGKSVKPVQRLKDFGTANPDKLTILGTLEGNREKEFHERFNEYRIDPKREWFSMGPALLDFLKAEFKCALRQKRPGRPNTQRAESWESIVDRAEELFGCGLRHEDWDEFYDVMRDEIVERAAIELELNEVEEWTGEQLNELDELTEPLDSIVFSLEKWWPWVEGWNTKNSGRWFDVYLLFKKPAHPRQLEELLYCLAKCGYLSDANELGEFVRLDVAFCWRERCEDEWAGEIQRLPILNDVLFIIAEQIYHKRDMVIIGMDELADFRLLGDNWYRRNGLPIPAEAKKISDEPDPEPETTPPLEAA